MEIEQNERTSEQTNISIFQNDDVMSRTHLHTGAPIHSPRAFRTAVYVYTSMTTRIQIWNDEKNKYYVVRQACVPVLIELWVSLYFLALCTRTHTRAHEQVRTFAS